MAVCLGMLAAASSSASHPGVIQEQQKVFEPKKRPPALPEAVQLIEIKARRDSKSSEESKKPEETFKAVRLNESFEGGEHWLKGASFRFKNHLDKEIVWMELDLIFPETVTSGNEMAFPIRRGRHPDLNETAKEPLSVKPGEEVTFTIDEAIYARIVRFIEKRHHIPTINKVIVGIGLIIFADNTGYNGVNYYRRDPNDPKRWINVGVNPPSN
jgi:hypothetical protein